MREPALAADATLRVEVEDGSWAYVTINHDRQETPDAKFHLRAGTYSVHLHATDLGIEMRCSVTLEPGQVKLLRVALDDRRCDD